MNRAHIIVFFMAAMMTADPARTIADTSPMDPVRVAKALLNDKGLTAHAIPLADFHEGIPPAEFHKRAGASYKPSFNEEPSIPAQCWIETGYGTQNACLYCHTDYLADINHGNAFPLGEDQILYSFPSPDLNKVLWRNTIFPQEISARLKEEGIDLPDPEDVDYVRHDNWQPAFDNARAGGTTGWLNPDADDFLLFPALNPRHLFPFNETDPTGNSTHGFVDKNGFVRDEKSGFTGWRAVNFFPYGIFTPLSGSVSGIYIRLPEPFMTRDNQFSRAVYEKNLDLLETNIKNRPMAQTQYFGDASRIPVKRGFFPVGTEFAHPLHYVDLNADGESGHILDGVAAHTGPVFEFPGTRSRRIKEMRYMYKYKEVGIEDITEEAHYESVVIGHEGQGWVDNNAGWVLAGYIENLQGNLRAQTTEEMMQCIGCHGKVGNTVDSVWSFQRKLPGADGWKEMDYGAYDSARPKESRLQDYVHADTSMGEQGYFYHVVVGADLYGVMPDEIAEALKDYAAPRIQALGLAHPLDAVFNDDLLKNMTAEERRAHLLDRQKVMRAYVADQSYLAHDLDTGRSHVKGTLLYPSFETMKKNIFLYRKIVLDQSFNLGKDVFGMESDNVPFTFRSDGTVKDADGRVIPVGEIITSRPYDEEGTGITPTGIVRVNNQGEPVDETGRPVDIETHPEHAAGHISTGGAFDTRYNPILSDTPLPSRKN
ncbi:MAG: hypothetical protein ACQEQ5_13065 [Thermodesulfobacteriota bacterium]